MLRWQTILGVLIGFILGVCILTLMGGGRRTPPPSGPILSECDGHFRDLVMHYEPTVNTIVLPPYRDFLSALEDDITVHILCTNRAAFDELISAVGPIKCQIQPILVNHPITTWSRDRWLALAPACDGQPTTLLSPKGEAAEEIWPARAGDQLVGHDIAKALAPTIHARRSEFYFDAGDFLADSENVFVVSRVLPNNIQHTIGHKEEFLDILNLQFKRRVILLDQSPDHHAAMFMNSVGNHTMLVGDPSLAKNLCQSDALELPGGPDFTPETQRLFDAVADQCAASGYKVIRIPVIPACDSRTYITYTNVLMDQQGARRIVYFPTYQGVDGLNAAARAIWQTLGYEIRPVDCTSTFRHFGCLHCLVNVLHRS
jgi:hypothetical protein